MAAASRNHQVLKQTFRLFSPRGVEGLSGRSPEELEESDVWSCQPDTRQPSSRPQVAITRKKPEASAATASVPVNVPDWPKTLLQEYKSSYSYKERNVDEDDDDDIDGDVRRLPPHEMVMRGRAASLSVVEGAGRTLKGRDLSRVRNAIWAQTGFQD